MVIQFVGCIYAPLGLNEFICYITWWGLLHNRCMWKLYRYCGVHTKPWTAVSLIMWNKVSAYQTHHLVAKVWSYKSQKKMDALCVCMLQKRVYMLLLQVLGLHCNFPHGLVSTMERLYNDLKKSIAYILRNETYNSQPSISVFVSRGPFYQHGLTQIKV